MGLPGHLSSDEIISYKYWRDTLFDLNSDIFRVRDLAWLIGTPDENAIKFLLPDEAYKVWYMMKELYWSTDKNENCY